MTPTDRVRDCTTCAFKATAGQMVDPCFPCLLEFQLVSNEPKEPYSEWIDDRIPMEEIRRQKVEEFKSLEKTFNELMANDPEFRAMMEETFGPPPEEKLVAEPKLKRCWWFWHDWRGTAWDAGGVISEECVKCGKTRDLACHGG